MGHDRQPHRGLQWHRHAHDDGRPSDRRGTLSQGTYGTINLSSGGTLQIGTGTNSGVLLGGTGALTNNGTLIFNRSDASTYSGVLSGSGALVKQGAGTLTISGSSNYTGVGGVERPPL